MPLLILHGLDGNEPDHWQTWLAEQAAAAGIEVRYPQLPSPATPRRDAWCDAVLPLLPADLDPELDVVAHSLGCDLWGHLARRTRHAVARRVLLVAPPSPSLVARDIPTFDPAPPSRDLLDCCPDTKLLLGSDDPWLPDPGRMLDCGLPAERVQGGAHLNVESGYGPWPAMLRWAQGADVPSDGWGR